MSDGRLTPWRVMDTSREFVVWSVDVDDLATQIHRKYGAWIRRPFVVSIEIDDHLRPIGSGEVLTDDSRRVITPLRIRSAVTTPRRAA